MIRNHKKSRRHKITIWVSVIILLNLLTLGYMQVYIASSNSMNKEQIIMSNVTFDERGNYYSVEIMGKDICNINKPSSPNFQTKLFLDALLPLHIQSVTEILDFINK